MNSRTVENLPKTYKYISDGNDNIFHSNISNKCEVENWIISLQAITKETWRISKTFKTSSKYPRVVFKRLYHCHFNSRRRKITKNLKEKKSKNIDCPAKLSLTIKKSNSENEFPCTIKFIENHNHRLNVIDALRERPIGDEAKNHILQLFEKGHSASSAYHTYCVSKMEELGDQYESIAFDRFYFPTKNDVSNLWKSNFKKHYGERSGAAMLLKLNDLLSAHKTNNGTVFKIVTNNDSEYAVAICTPIMQRAQILPQSSEVMFVDATGNCDTDNHKVYFFLTHTAAGGIPLGCILTNTGKNSNFNLAVAALFEIMPTKINPAVIMTDDDLSERNILKKYWPNSKLLLCTFHVLKACWRWLCNGKNQVSKDLTQAYYKLFRDILYAKTDNELNQAIFIFNKECNHENYKKYVEKKICFIEDWCLLFRQRYILRGSDTNNYSETMFRLLKDIPLERTKAFNLPQLADFIVTGFESYFKQRILDLLHGRVTKTIFKRYSPKYDNNLMAVKNVGNMEFEVASETNKNLLYKVDMLVCKCSCPFGFNGKFCKHQGAVLCQFDELKAINTLCKSTKCDLYKVATGIPASIDVFLPLQSIDVSSNSTRNYEICDHNPCEMTMTYDNQLDVSNYDSPIDVPSNEEIFELQKEWNAFSNEILNKLKQNPTVFHPAIKSFLANKEKYAKSENSLISGLFTAFKYQNLNTCKKYRNTKLKGKKISVQPTAISRRKTKVSGKRRLTGGTLSGKKKSSHNLTLCVEKNIGLGDNKRKK